MKLESNSTTVTLRSSIMIETKITSPISGNADFAEFDCVQYYCFTHPVIISTFYLSRPNLKMSKNNLVLPLSFQKALLSLCKWVRKKENICICDKSVLKHAATNSAICILYYLHRMVGLSLLARSDNAGIQWKYYMLLRWYVNSLPCILIFHLNGTLCF